jgi:tRNA A-37 threonylcarbamoyl transferase component Bud32/DNA-directed RNA polymerase subunit RPC12/RpoP
LAGEENILVGKIALNNRFITREQLDECIKLQREGRREPIGKLLQEKGYITKTQLVTVLELQDKRLTRPHATLRVPKKEILFGRLAIKLAMVTKEQVYESLREQAILRDMGKKYRLGQVMIMRGYLSVPQVEMLLKVQHKTILQCPKCSTQFNVEGYLPGMKIECRKCGSGTLEEPSKLDSPEVAEDEHRSRLAGHRIGDYELLEEISRGGMGVVYRAKRKDFKRTVALKMLLDEKRSSENEIVRFKHEAESVARLSHPNIVAIYDLNEAGGQYYYAMEFVEGESLEDVLERGRPGIRKSLEITLTLTRALQHAHSQGIYHRDVKPSNILIEKSTGRIVLTDFGLAVQQEQTSRLTRSGYVMGTPAYMAPEQCQRQSSPSAFDARTDIYQLGTVLYEMITGVPPFDSPSPIEILLHKISEDAPEPRLVNRAIPLAVQEICLLCLQRDKAQRYQSCEELAEDIETYLDKGGQVALELRNPVLGALKALVTLGLIGITAYCGYELYLFLSGQGVLG